MTTTLPAPTAEVERITYAEAFETIAHLIANGAPQLNGFAVQGYGEDPRLTGAPILTLSFDSHAALDAWAVLLDFKPATTKTHHTKDHYEYDVRDTYGRWHGWHTNLRSWVNRPEPREFDEDCSTCRAFRLDGPIDDTASACRFCGGEMTHRLGCLALAPECVDCSMPGGHQESCAFASRCEGPYTCAAVDDEGGGWCMEPVTTKGALCEDCDGALSRFRAATSRVDPDAAAQIPVVVLEVSPNPAPAVDFDDEIAAVIADPRETIPYTTINPEESCGYLPDGPFSVVLTRNHAALDEPTVQLPHPGVHYVPEGVHPRGHVAHEPTDHGVPIVDVLTVDPELDVIERDDNAVMGRVLPQRVPGVALADEMAVTLDEPAVRIPLGAVVPSDAALVDNPPQMLFAEAAERLADAMLGEAAE